MTTAAWKALKELEFELTLPIEGKDLDPEHRNANLRARTASSRVILETRVKTDENVLKAKQADNTARWLAEIAEFKKNNPRYLKDVSPAPVE